jgi:putative ABC transport system substrate-binding protein
MRRREFIALFSSGAIWPLAAAAQTQQGIPRVAFIFGGAAKTPNRSFRLRLKELGYVEGQSIELEFRSTEGHLERLPELLAEVVRLNPAVLVTPSGQAALAAQAATRTIPIVMFAPDPVELGLVTSLARPGGNVTGLSYQNTEIIAKRLELLKDLLPGLARVAVLRNPRVASHAILWRETGLAARKLNVALQALDAKAPEDFEAAFATAKRGNAQALLAFDDPLSHGLRPKIAALAATSRLPAVYGLREFPEQGGLMSYGPSFALLYRRAADFVDRILKGAKPADLPVEQPTKLELVINLKTARELGLTIPPSLLALADDVIE